MMNYNNPHDNNQQFSSITQADVAIFNNEDEMKDSNDTCVINVTA